MAMLFKNELHEDFGTWPLAYIETSGRELGPLQDFSVGVDPDPRSSLPA
jgi:hypothetical protein